MSGPLHCDDVIRELAVPTAGRDPAALADHLAACPACSLWADRSEQLDRLWDATRPVEPSAATWDALWANVRDRLDHPAAPEPEVETSDVFGLATLSPAAAVAGRPWQRWGLGLFGLAQAAALLVGFSLLMPGGVETVAVAGPIRVNIDPGQVVVIRDDGEVQVRGPKASPGANGLDESFAMFNALEAMAE